MSCWERPGKSDEYYTPGYLFKALECDFDMDVASPVDRTYCSVPARQFITENSLQAQWNGFVWCNPPFGGKNAIEPWLEKMAEHANGIALTPDRTSADWWMHAALKCSSMLVGLKKIKFIRPDGSIAGSPGNGTTLFGYGAQGDTALQKAEDNGLGLYVDRFRKVNFVRMVEATNKP